jgi:hypothetical protein
MNNAFAFLVKSEIEALTGRKQKGAQCDQLRRMGVPFWVNASGNPVVARSAIEGRTQPAQNDLVQTWTPPVLR